MNNKKVWFVTGASQGLGLSLVQTLLDKGFQVAGTSRNLKGLEAAVKSSTNFLPLQMNLLDETSVQQAINKTVETFGQLDVVVNNAGFGQLGTLEEATHAEVSSNFETNVYGTINVIRYAMPILRKQQSGHVINISSIGGLVGEYPGWGIYCSTKFAVVGLTEGLSAEAKEFGIHASVVYPGYFRTNFLEKSSLTLPKNPIAEYTAARKAEAFHTDEMNGKQQGDPDKAAIALIELAAMQNPPVHVFLGSDAYGAALNKLDVLQAEIKAQEALSKSTDY